MSGLNNDNTSFKCCLDNLVILIQISIEFQIPKINYFQSTFEEQREQIAFVIKSQFFLNFEKKLKFLYFSHHLFVFTVTNIIIIIIIIVIVVIVIVELIPRQFESN